MMQLALFFLQICFFFIFRWVDEDGNVERLFLDFLRFR